VREAQYIFQPFEIGQQVWVLEEVNPILKCYLSYKKMRLPDFLITLNDGIFIGPKKKNWKSELGTHDKDTN
jgi:hypothetical protein